jgi:hypothetical protein
MRFKFAKIKREGIDFTLVEPYSSEEDGVILKKLTDKYDPINKNVIIVRKKEDGLNNFAASDFRKFNHFSTVEKFDNLEWIESFIE